MNQKIFATIVEMLEDLSLLREVEESLRGVMRATATVSDLGPPVRSTRHHAERLVKLAEKFEILALEEQLPATPPEEPGPIEPTMSWP